jgi:hypothetical protein
MTGIIFTYFSYPFFNSLLTAITETTGIFEGWDTIRYLMWAGYITILALWLIVFPASRLMSKDSIGG